MITIKYIPNILNNSNRIIKQLPFYRSKSVIDYLKESGLEYLDKRVIVSGIKIVNLNQFINDNEEILLLNDTGITLSALWFAAKALWFYVIMPHPILTTLFLASAGYSIYAATRRIRLPSYGQEEDSPTYGWDGPTTTQDVGIPIPLIYGTMIAPGNVINAFVTTDEDKNYLNVLIALCEGEISKITDIKINDNPIENFDGVTIYTRSGTNTQSIIPNFNDLHNLYAVNTALTKNNPYVYTMVGTDIEGFRLHLQFPNGISQINSESGQISAWSVTYKVEYRITGVGAYTSLGATTINYKSRTVVRRIYEKMGLTPGQYDIRITKTSDDTSDYFIGDMALQSVDEIQTDDLVYPNTVLLGIKTLASEQLSGGMPKFTCVVEGKLVSIPKVMNGPAEVNWDDYYWDNNAVEYKLLSDNTSLTWDGTTYITRFSGNPIWCMKDLLINSRYGLGEYIDSTEIDDAVFLEMSRYCEERVPDGKGGYEKRFIIDVTIDSRQKALDWIIQLCATFRGMPFYAEDSIKLRIDKPADPVQLFTMQNIEKNSFTQTWKPINDIPNIIDIQYMDKNKNYEQDDIAYTDNAALAAGDPKREKTMRLYTTRISQAIREGRYALKIAKYINRSITFSAGVDAIAAQPGDIISVSHDVPQWGYSGRISRGYVSEVTLDREITIVEGNTYAIIVRLSDDTIEERTVTNAAGTTNIITVTSSFSSAPKQYDVYSFGRTNAVKKDFRIISLEKSGNNDVKIDAVEYDANVYDDSDISLPINNYSDLNLAIPYVENLVLTERLAKLKDGTIEDVIDIWFKRPSRENYVQTVKSFRIYISRDNVSWEMRGETFTDSFSIIGGIEDLQTYYITITTVNGFGEETAINNSTKSSITIVGKSAPPSDITSFIVNQSRDRLFLGWTEISDVDRAGYEIRTGSDWDSGVIVVSGIKSDHYDTADFRTGSGQSYWIKAIDTTGHYSQTAKQAVITVDNIPFQNIIITYSEQTNWSGVKTHTEKSGNNLIISAGYTTGVYATPIRDIGYVATFRICIEVITAVNQGRAFNSDSTTRFNTYSALRFTGEESPGAATFRIRTSEDNITWTSWVTWQVGDYKCRYFQLEMTLTRNDVNSALNCSQFDYYADLPDIDEYDERRIVVAAAGDTVTFSKTFHENPIVNISILSGGGIYYRFSVSPTTTGFTVFLYDIAGNLRIGTYRYHAHGV